MALLEIEQLQVRFGARQIVSDLSLRLEAGQVLALVGESGSGKSVSTQAILGLLDSRAQVSAAQLSYAKTPLLGLSAKARRTLLGREMALIAQDPASALNPSLSVGYQLKEVLAQHLKLKGAAATQKALELLEMVEIPAAASRLSAYAHELSGGMNQRVAIAMAIACQPRLLIADEPTTALDVTVQKQIMALLKTLQREHNMAMLLVSHDLALVAENAEHICVMYAGQWVEQGATEAVLAAPAHPYTQALLNALPEHHKPGQRLLSLTGQVPQTPLPGCLLAPRCPYKQAPCERPVAPRVFNQQQVRCLYPQGAV